MYLIRIGGKRQSDESQLSYRPIKAFRSSVLFFLPKIEEGPRLVRVSGVVVGGEGSRQGAGEPGAPRWADSDSGGELSSAFFTWAPPSGQRAGGDEGHCG